MADSESTWRWRKLGSGLCLTEGDYVILPGGDNWILYRSVGPPGTLRGALDRAGGVDGITGDVPGLVVIEEDDDDDDDEGSVRKVVRVGDSHPASPIIARPSPWHVGVEGVLTFSGWDLAESYSVAEIHGLTLDQLWDLSKDIRRHVTGFRQRSDR